MMAKILKEKEIIPDVILSSTAVRAFEYAKILADKLEHKKKKIIATKDLYIAGENEMLNIVKEIDDNYKTAFLLGHNPGITDFVNSLCEYDLDNLPTSGVFGIDFDVDSWKDVEFGKGKFMMFEYPRKYY